MPWKSRLWCIGRLPTCAVFKRSLRTVRPEFQAPTTDRAALDEPLPADDPRRFKPILALDHNTTFAFYEDPILTTFTNRLMVGGRKALAKKIMADCFEFIKIQQLKKWMAADEGRRPEIECNPLTIFHKALQNCCPALQLLPLKRGGITYMVPSYINEKQSRTMAIKWLITMCRVRGHTESMAESLGKELLDAFKNDGRVVKRKQDLHRQCEANKAFAHYRWS